MKPAKSILVYVDTHAEHPQPAVDVALALAKPHRLPVVFCDAVDPNAWSRTRTDAKVAQAIDAFAREKEDRLRDLADRASGDGLETRAALLRGKPVIEIVREVLRNDHGLFIKTMMPEDATPTRPFGALGRALLRKCPCPVYLVQPGHEQVKKILVALDPFDQAETPSELNQRLLHWSRTIGATHHAPIRLLHVFRVYGERILLERMNPGDFEKYANEELAHARKRVEYIRESTRDDDTRIEVDIVEGSAEQVIPAYATNNNIDLLVLGTVARSGIRGILIGNTAEVVLENAPCSILAVKPPEFVSPISL